MNMGQGRRGEPEIIGVKNKGFFELVHESRAMWCVVRNQKAPLWGDTDRHLCEVEGHKIGPSDCSFKTILVVKPLDGEVEK